MSGNRSVSIGQHPVYGHEASQYNETSVERRLGENHGGVKRPMDPVSCRTSDDFPVFPGLSGTNTEKQFEEVGKRRIVIDGTPYTVMVFFQTDTKETGIGKIMQLAKRDIMANPMHKLE